MGRRVLLGVSGSIAAYKAALLVSDLMARGHEVRVTMTPGAARFVAPLTFSSLTHHPVAVDVWDETKRGEITHVALADWAETVVVAPASAGVLARLALGLPSDMLCATALSFRGPLVIAPAMESAMFEHPATQLHIETLQRRGAVVVGPVSGRLASGGSGVGRLAAMEDVADAVDSLFDQGDLSGATVLVTAGPTYEPIDDVRFIGNRSSGKMGYAVADAAVRRGASVVLVNGPTALPAPRGVTVIPVETGQEMLRAVLDHVKDADITVMAAAVADFRPQVRSSGKIKRTGRLTLQLEPTEDIARAAVDASPRTVHVGFALESHDLVAASREKLARKGQDLVVGNSISAEHNPFGADSNTVTLVTSAGIEELPPLTKAEVASRILDRAVALLAERR